MDNSKKKKKKKINLQYLKDSPPPTAAAPLLRGLLLPSRSSSSSHAANLPNTLNLLQSQLQQLLLPDNVQMSADPEVLARKSFDLGLGQLSAQTHVKLARKVVVEFGQELDIQEEDGRRGELVGHHVQKDFGAVVLVGFGGALF